MGSPSLLIPPDHRQHPIGKGSIVPPMRMACQLLVPFAVSPVAMRLITVASANTLFACMGSLATVSTTDRLTP